MVAGNMAAEFVVDSETSNPPTGALPLIVKSAAVIVPPVTLDGFNTRLVGAGAFTVRFAVLLAAPREAEMTTAWLAATATVSTTKDIVV
jgi:hypothetical protein